jgi:hypothetical protein
MRTINTFWNWFQDNNEELIHLYDLQLFIDILNLED